MKSIELNSEPNLNLNQIPTGTYDSHRIRSCARARDDFIHHLFRPLSRLHLKIHRFFQDVKNWNPLYFLINWQH